MLSQSLSSNMHVQLTRVPTYQEFLPEPLSTVQTHPSICWSHMQQVTRPLDKKMLLKNIFLISQPKHMLTVLKRTITMRWFI